MFALPKESDEQKKSDLVTNTETVLKQKNIKIGKEMADKIKEHQKKTK